MYVFFHHSPQENKHCYVHYETHISALSYPAVNRSALFYCPAERSPDIPTLYQFFRFRLKQELFQISSQSDFCLNITQPVRSDFHFYCQRSYNRYHFLSRSSDHGNLPCCIPLEAFLRSWQDFCHISDNLFHHQMQYTDSDDPAHFRQAVLFWLLLYIQVHVYHLLRSHFLKSIRLYHILHPEQVPLEAVPSGSYRT